MAQDLVKTGGGAAAAADGGPVEEFDKASPVHGVAVSGAEHGGRGLHTFKGNWFRGSVELLR